MNPSGSTSNALPTYSFGFNDYASKGNIRYPGGVAMQIEIDQTRLQRSQAPPSLIGKIRADKE